MDYFRCTSKNSKASSRQERDRQDWQTERISRRRNLSRKEEEEEEKKEKDIPRAKQTQEAVKVIYAEARKVKSLKIKGR